MGHLEDKELPMAVLQSPLENGRNDAQCEMRIV